MAATGTVTVQSGGTEYTVNAEVLGNLDLHLVCTDEHGAVADLVLCFDQGTNPVKTATLEPPPRQS